MIGSGKKLLAFASILVVILVSWAFVSKYVGDPELDPDVTTRETDLAVLGYISSQRAERKSDVCWLGAIKTSVPRRVVAAASSHWDRFILARSFHIVDEVSSVGQVESCLDRSRIVFVRFPLPDMSQMPTALGTKLTSVVSELMGNKDSVFERKSISFSYPDGISFQVFERKDPHP